MPAEPTEKTSPVSKNLRSKHKDLTQDLILGALAEVIEEDGIHAFSVQAVADRAGVSHRTVYRHFSNRDALLNGLSQKMERIMGEAGNKDVPDSLNDLSEDFVGAIDYFEKHDRLVRAFAVAPFALGFQASGVRRRDAGFKERVREAAPHLTAKEIDQRSAVIRYLCSSLAYTVFRERFEMSSKDLSAALTWALRVLTQDIISPSGE